MLKSQKNLTDLERSGKLKENNLRKELQRLKESQEDIKRRHKNAVRELSDVKGKKPQAESSLHFTVYSINNEVQWAFSLSFLNGVKEKKLKLKAHCTALFIK